MKKIATLILCIAICLSAAFSVAAEQAEPAESRDFCNEQVLAETLRQLGLFKGVSSTDFDLERAPTRIEALVMLIRLMGIEGEVLDGSWRHPFTDVPEWADPYVGYAYFSNIANGVSATEFGSGDANAAMYLTFVLRALEYSDKNGEDFSWDKPFDLAKEVGILPDIVDTENFLRADVASVSYAALAANYKDSEYALCDSLHSLGVFDSDTFFTYYDYNFFKELPPESYTAPTKKLSAVEISKKCAPAVFTIQVYGFNGEIIGIGSGFFISPDGYAITNQHVAKHGLHFAITTTDGTKYDDVVLLDTGKGIDMALLKVNSAEPFPYLECGNSNSVVQGQAVYAIGSPEGLDNTMSTGIVSNPKRYSEKQTYIQISVPITHGSSGGALINEYGEAVGITTAGYGVSDLNLATPINYTRLLDQTLTEDIYTWGDSYYEGFETIYDFGVFTSLDIVSVEKKLHGYLIEYDMTDVYDIVSADGKTVIHSKEDCLAYCIAFYISMIEDELECVSDSEDAYIYCSETEKVIVSPDYENAVIKVVVEKIPVYYEEYPTVPDFGWYLGLPLISADKKETSILYTYNWTSYDSADAFLDAYTRYAVWLENEGFTLADYGEDKNTGFYVLEFRGNGFKVVLTLEEKNISVYVKKL